jgi:VWFA-related protein
VGDNPLAKRAEFSGMPTARVTRVTIFESITERGSRCMKSAALLLAFLLFTPAVVAQTPYIETFEVRLHNLDVVVTDKKGTAVRGLTKDDFVVVENGATQEVTNFSIYDSQSTVVESTPQAIAPGSSANAPAVASAPPPRRFVFFIDDLGLQKMARQRLFKNLKSFVDQMREGDLAAVVRPTSQTKIVQQFTGDRAALEKVLQTAMDESGESFTGTKQELITLRWRMKTAGTPGLRFIAKTEYADAAARRVEHRLGQVRALTSSLGEFPGKKVVILVAMGLSTKPGSEAWSLAELLHANVMEDADWNAVVPDELDVAQDRQDGYNPIIHDLTRPIADLARSAAANGVTIYALEPDVPLDLSVRGAASIPVAPTKGQQAGPDTRTELQPAFQMDFMQNAAATMTSLTEKTGGRWFRGLSSIDDLFRQVSDDVNFYYSLAYRATGETDKARAVSVKVRNRPDLHVRTRSEVMEKSTDREMTDLVVASLLYPRTVNELGIGVTPGKPQKERGLYTIPLDVVIPLKNLTFLPIDGGKYAASFDMHYAAAGEQRDFGTGGKQEQRIELSPEQYAHVLDIAYRYKTAIQVSPGRARIAIGILDTATKLTGFRSVEVIAQ